MLKLSQSAYVSLRQHGEETYPQECCGVLLGHFDDQGAEAGSKTVSRVERCANTRDDSPRNRYHIDPRDLIRIQREGRKRGEDIVGFYHSHPDHPAQWSSTDLAEAHWFGCSYVITSVEKGVAAATKSFELTGTNEDNKKLVDERLVQTMTTFLVAVLGLLFWVGSFVGVSAFFSSIKRSALREQPRQDGTELEFFPVVRMQVLVRMVLVLLAAFGALLLFAVRKEGQSFYALLGPATVFLLISLVRPVSVIIDAHGIRQRRWFLPDKEIKWSDVASVAYGTNTGTMYVRSKTGGPKIRFSIFLVGRARFQREIRAHAPEGDICSENDE